MGQAAQVETAAAVITEKDLQHCPMARLMLEAVCGAHVTSQARSSLYINSVRTDAHGAIGCFTRAQAVPLPCPVGLSQSAPPKVPADRSRCISGPLLAKQALEILWGSNSCWAAFASPRLRVIRCLVAAHLRKRCYHQLHALCQFWVSCISMLRSSPGTTGALHFAELVQAHPFMQAA